jgi:Na+-driven multidrug efflux pump
MILGPSVKEEAIRVASMRMHTMILGLWTLYLRGKTYIHFFFSKVEVVSEMLPTILLALPFPVMLTTLAVNAFRNNAGPMHKHCLFSLCYLSVSIKARAPLEDG